ncbi:hypothetical protein GLA29479_3021 [Lysobacter antibioticus]|nr:hypothetical protein GLA29479_3021 [Lysobacter antibioticus]
MLGQAGRKRAVFSAPAWPRGYDAIGAACTHSGPPRRAL